MSLEITTPIEDYVREHGVRLDETARALIAETRVVAGADAFMQVSPQQGQLLAMLCTLTAPHEALELGTFTGYSAMCIAGALPPDGRLVTCDVDERWLEVARRHWRRAAVEDRIVARLSPARDVLLSLPDEPCLDFVFVDADKPHYPEIYELVVRRLRPGGLLLIDNVLWGGRVADPAVDDPWTEAIRTVNRVVLADERVDMVMTTVGDGLTVVRRR